MASLCGVGEVTEWFKVAVLKAPVAQAHFPRKPRISNENDGANRAIRASRNGSRWHEGRHTKDGPETRLAPRPGPAHEREETRCG